MQLVPIPQTDEYLNQLFPFWSRFLPDIAKRSKEPIATLLQRVASKEVQPILIWDETVNEPAGLAGIRYHMRGNDRIAEWLWMTGRDRKSWMPLLGELERYLREHERCVELRPVCRKGWTPYLKQRGYRETHVTMEKRL